MNTAPRRSGPPRGLALGSAVASSICGLVLLVAGPTASAPAPRGLLPATVVDHVLRQLPAEARNVRFNGLYGSGHAGAWEFVAHLTWRDVSGQIRGGRIHLPETAGQLPFDTTFDVDRLATEEKIGWPSRRLLAVLRPLERIDAPLALLEFVPDTGLRPAPIVTCYAERVGPGRCIGYGTDRRQVFADELFEVPFGRALSVQRRGAPVSTD